MIPITTVKLGPEVEELVIEVIRSGMLAQGPMVARLEESFAALHGVEHAVAVNNGTTALVAAMQALDIGRGDEVITSPFTFVATVNAILEAGATVRFADIGADFNIDPDEIAGVANDATAAVAPVHLYGYMADMTRVEEVAAELGGLAIVEDAAQSVGAHERGRKAGSIGVGCFSLYATKNVNTGEGGMVTTNDDALADRLRLLRNQGMRARYQYEVAGHNYRMTDLAAAVGVPQIEAIDSIIAARVANASALREGLAGIEGLQLPPEPAADRSHVYHQFTVRIAPDGPIGRDDFVDAMVENGVGCGIYYPKVVYDYDCYRDHPGVVADPVPNAFAAAAEVASLPVHPHLSSSDLDQIVSTVRTVMDR